MEYGEVVLTTKEGEKTGAAFFKGKTNRAAVFVPGAVFNKESWFFLARPLQLLGISSLSLDKRRPYAVISAIGFIKDKGLNSISLVGGSMGGGAILSALEQMTDQHVDRIALLAPYGGSPVTSRKTDKLFIVAKEDALGLYPHVRSLYGNSSDPKIIKEYKGQEHAQHLFNGEHKEHLTRLIVDFISA